MKNIKKAVCIGGIALLATLSVGCLTSADVPQKTITHVVKTGETLWDIAYEAKGEDEDVREVIYRIEQDNHLTGQYIHPGQRLTITVNEK